MFGDCAVNVTPDSEQLATIAMQSANTAAAFGVDPPLVAMLSYSTGASGSGPEVEKVWLRFLQTNQPLVRRYLWAHSFMWCACQSHSEPLKPQIMFWIQLYLQAPLVACNQTIPTGTRLRLPVIALLSDEPCVHSPAR